MFLCVYVCCLIFLFFNCSMYDLFKAICFPSVLMAMHSLFAQDFGGGGLVFGLGI